MREKLAWCLDRKHLRWLNKLRIVGRLTALTVAIYNLKKRSPHQGRDGFFHWKQDIATFLEVHWNVILGPQM